MDLFAVGTPVIDLFAKATDNELAAFGVKKGATNYFPAPKLAGIEWLLSKKITYRYAGDNARNVCEGFAALGGFCGFQGAVGADKAGAEFEANLEECGIAAFLEEKRGSTGKIIALVTPDKQRTFLADLGVARQCSEYESEAIASCRMLYIASFNICFESPIKKLTMRYLEECRRLGKKIAISIESYPLVAAHRVFLLGIVKKYADILFLNSEESGALLGAGASKKLLSLKPKMLIFLKNGLHGSLVIHRGKAVKVLALPAKVIDSKGGGEAYAAGVLDGMRRGFSPLSCAKRGCYLATKVVEKVGAGIPLKHTRLRIRHLR